MILTEHAKYMLHNLIMQHEQQLKHAKAFNHKAVYGLHLMFHKNNLLLAITPFPDKDNEITQDIPLYMNKETDKQLKNAMLDAHDTLILHINNKTIPLKL